MNKRVMLFIFLLCSLLSPQVLPENHTPQLPPPMTAWLNLLDFNPKTGDIDARIYIEVPDYYVGAVKSFNQALTLVDESNVEDAVLTMPKDVPYQTYNFVLESRYEVTNINSPFLYPFDTQSVDISMFVSNSNYKKLPILLNCELCPFPFDGYVFDINDKSTSDRVDVTINLRRTISTIIFNCILNTTFLIIGITISIIALRAIKGTIQVETGTLAFVGSLMFALPVMREIQPDAPPVGVLIDYIGFFIAEGLIIISLIIIIIYWLKAKPSQSEKPIVFIDRPR